MNFKHDGLNVWFKIALPLAIIFFFVFSSGLLELWNENSKVVNKTGLADFSFKAESYTTNTSSLDHQNEFGLPNPLVVSVPEALTLLGPQVEACRVSLEKQDKNHPNCVQGVQGPVQFENFLLNSLYHVHVLNGRGKGKPYSRASSLVKFCGFKEPYKEEGWSRFSLNDSIGNPSSPGIQKTKWLPYDEAIISTSQLLAVGEAMLMAAWTLLGIYHGCRVLAPHEVILSKMIRSCCWRSLAFIGLVTIYSILIAVSLMLQLAPLLGVLFLFQLVNDVTLFRSSAGAALGSNRTHGCLRNWYQ